MVQELEEKQLGARGVIGVAVRGFVLGERNARGELATKRISWPDGLIRIFDEYFPIEQPNKID
jgi:hypothetical protein